MNSINSAYWFLRIGFGASYLYSGADMFLNPRHWYGYMPHWLSTNMHHQGFTVDQYLKAQGTAEIIMGVLFIAWFINEKTAFGFNLLKYLYWLVGIQISFILLFSGVDPNTFRDFVYIGGVGALSHLLNERRKINNL